MAVFLLYISAFVVFAFLFFFFFTPKTRWKALQLWIITIIVYGLYLHIAYAAYLEKNTFFMFPDQNYFYNIADNLSYSGSLLDIFRKCFVYRIHGGEQEAAHFVMGGIAYIARTYFDGNSVLLQMTCVSLIATFIPVFLFRLLWICGYGNCAFKYSLLYALFSYILYYSPWIMRDIHISLLFVVFFNTIAGRFNFINVIYQVLLLLVLLEFRPETGMFIIPFIIYYVYSMKGNDSISKKTKYFFRAMIILALIPGFIVSLYFFQVGLESLKYYDEGMISNMNDVGQMAQIIYSLPIGIRNIIIAFYSQISPFPCWTRLLDSKTLLQTEINIAYTIAPIFWFVVFYIVVKGTFKQYRYFPGTYKVFVWFMLFFLLLNSVNMDIRRMMCCYPITYLLFIWLKQNWNYQKVKICKFEAISVYSIASLLFLLFV